MPRARTGESDEPSTRRRGGHPLLVAGVILALGAAGVLVLSDDSRWLRLGVVAALWAALVGAFIAARYRGQVADRDDRAADLQAVYELELEREIAARREYELQVEAEIRSEVDEQSRRDVAALRDELRTLRTTLETLIGGEVLVERYALAQSTRMRPIQERKHLPAAVNGPAPEPVTEQFERVTELRAVGSPGPRPASPLPRRADRTERPEWPTQVRQPTGEQPVADADPRVVELPPTAVAQFRPPAADHPRSPEPSSPEIERIRSIAEQSLSRIERVRSQPPEPPRPGPGEQSWPARPAEQSASRMERVRPQAPLPPPGEQSWPARPAERSQSRMERPRPVSPPPEPQLPPEPPRMAPPRMPLPVEQSQSRMEQVRAQPPLPPPGEQSWPARPAERSQSRMERVRPQPPLPPPEPPRMAPPRIPLPVEQSQSRMERLHPPAAEPPRVPEPPEPIRTAWEERPVAPAQPEQTYIADAPSPGQEQPGRHSNESTGGRRRRAEPEPPQARRHARGDEQTGGRRRRAEDTPSWQELATWDPVVKATSRAWDTGSHARNPEPEASSGSHASGHSVADLLAAHNAERPRRRRRRED